MDKLYQCYQNILKMTTRKTINFLNWSLLCHELGRFVHLNLWEPLHKEAQVALFFQTLEVDFIKQWDDESHNILCDQLASFILPSQGCTYSMLLMENGWFLNVFSFRCRSHFFSCHIIPWLMETLAKGVTSWNKNKTSNSVHWFFHFIIFLSWYHVATWTKLVVLHVPHNRYPCGEP